MSFIESINNLNINMLIKMAMNIPDLSKDAIFQSYSKLISFTRECLLQNSESKLIGLAHMVYGWMPTMLEYNEIDQSENVINEISKGSIEIEFLEKIKMSINNSIVGGSKLLHFINPNDYAIFDSRVYRAITRKESYDYNTNNCNNYLYYIKRLRNMKNESEELKRILIDRNIVTK